HLLQTSLCTIEHRLCEYWLPAIPSPQLLEEMVAYENGPLTGQMHGQTCVYCRFICNPQPVANAVYLEEGLVYKYRTYKAPVCTIPVCTIRVSLYPFPNSY